MEHRDKCVASLFIFFFPNNEEAGETITEPPEVSYKVRGNQCEFVENKSHQTNLTCFSDGTCG